jgi:hypothetical protein
MSAEIWATVGTILGTIIFLIVPGIAYAWVVLDGWSEEADQAGT